MKASFVAENPGGPLWCSPQDAELARHIRAAVGSGVTEGL